MAGDVGLTAIARRTPGCPCSHLLDASYRNVQGHRQLPARSHRPVSAERRAAGLDRTDRIEVTAQQGQPHGRPSKTVGRFCSVRRVGRAPIRPAHNWPRSIRQRRNDPMTPPRCASGPPASAHGAVGLSDTPLLPTSTPRALARAVVTTASGKRERGGKKVRLDAWRRRECINVLPRQSPLLCGDHG